jgi:DNA-binding NarL/FixJ family response regulator
VIAGSVRVLFVDDNYLLAEGLRRRLGFERGLEYVGWAQTSEEAVGAAERGKADVVVLDVDMPGDSFELVRRFGEVSPAVKVVMFSGHIRRAFADRAIDSGAWGYISKNEAMDIVFDAIRRVAEGEFVLSPDVEAACRLER